MRTKSCLHHCGSPILASQTIMLHASPTWDWHIHSR